MTIFKCKMCGGDLEITPGSTVCECEYCGTQQTLPKLDDDRRANMYDRANHFRRANEFDKAMSMYEKILEEDKTDSEAYWSLVLCRYGIEYVEDPATHKRVPTVNRAQFTSIFMDEDYKSALEYADAYQRTVYEQEAAAIDEIQKGILAISQNEEPFDVFICYKETGADGRRTRDSVIATDLYHQLTQEGFKVFFARITLEDKLGQEYEPYIFAALNSAKVMVVLGTKPEHFNAVWVKNEWSRFLMLIRNGAKKTLIPAYRDMDPYDLPEEFSHLQAQDMNKLGFMQDLIRGIKKITEADKETPVVNQTTVINNNAASGSVAPLLKRAFMFLEDGEWDSANEYAEKVLDLDPECAKAYVVKLLADRKLNTQAQLHFSKSRNAEELFTDPIENDQNYKKALRFADPDLKRELEKDAADNAEEYDRRRYEDAKAAMNSAKTESHFKQAAALFDEISYYKDSEELAKQCLDKAELARREALKNVKYNEALESQRDLGSISAQENALQKFEALGDFKDSKQKAEECRERIAELEQEAENARIAAEKAAAKAKKNKIIAACAVAAMIAAVICIITIPPMVKYNKANKLLEQGSYDEAISLFTELGNYKDSTDLINECNYQQAVKYKDIGSYDEAVTMFEELGNYKDSAEKLKELAYTKAESLANDKPLKALSYFMTAWGCKDSAERVTKWNDSKTISSNYLTTIGLKKDGTVVAVGENDDGQCDVSDLKDIVSVAGGGDHTVGLKKDGTVVAVGENDDGQCDVYGWKDIVSVACGSYHTVGLKKDGTVVAVGWNKYRQCYVSGWKDIVSVAGGYCHTVGLKKDGTVVAVGWNKYGQCDVSDWKDIVSVACGVYHTVGLKKDGTVVAVGFNDDGQCDVSDWKDIVSVACGSKHTVGLKKDGTVVAVGSNSSDQCDVSGWKDIKTPSFD